MVDSTDMLISTYKENQVRLKAIHAKRLKAEQDKKDSVMLRLEKDRIEDTLREYHQEG